MMFGMDMDIDLDLDTDRIKDFLHSKLEEIKSTNVQLNKSLQHRKEIGSQYRKDITKENLCDHVRICEVFKKLHNNKYVLGLRIRNESDSNLEDANVILDWDASTSLSYKFYSISSENPNVLIDGLRWTNHLAQSGQIMIVLEAPLFIEQLTYTITGSITFQQNHKKINLQLPAGIQLSTQDITDNSVIVQMYKMIDGSIDDFLACAHSNQKQDFVMVIPANWNQLLETTLEVDCSLQRVNITSNRKFFIAHKIGASLEGALLEIENKDLSDEVNLTTYCRDRNVLITLIHYLHRHIINVVIVPKPFYRPELSLLDTTELIRESLRREVTCLEEFTGRDVVNYRSRLADLEHQTDVLMSRANQETK